MALAGSGATALGDAVAAASGGAGAGAGALGDAAAADAVWAAGDVAPADELRDKWKLVPQFVQARGLWRQHITSFDHLVREGLRSVLDANAELHSDADAKFFARFTNIYVGRPCLDGEAGTAPVTPHQCRLRDLTYAAPIFVDLTYLRGGESVSARNVCIGRMPIMLRSRQCWLADKTAAELEALGECTQDPGGYFVVRGAERVCLIQEQLSKNRIILELDPKGCISTSVTSSTAERKSRTVVVLKGDLLYLSHNSLGDDLSVVVLLKAMGVTSDQEIAALVGPEPDVVAALAPSLHEAATLGIVTQIQALHHIGGRAKARKAFNRAGVTNVEEGRTTLTTLVLTHVPSEHWNFRPKAQYICHMIRRVLLSRLGKMKLDDKDYYGNKRLELAGHMVGLVFEDAFKRLQAEMKRLTDLELSKRNRTERFDVVTTIKTDIITTAMNTAIATGNWNLKRFRMNKVGVTAIVARMAYMNTLGMMTRITSQFEKTRKVSGPRSLQGSQWGMLCPSDTPEGEACGLVKNLALTTHITTDEDPHLVRQICLDLGVEDAEALTGHELHAPGSFIVFLNGLILGVHRNPAVFARNLRGLRRNGKVGEFVSVYIHESHRTMHIATDGGRVCRPVIIVTPDGKPKLTARKVQELVSGVVPFRSFMRSGVCEYIDVNEENNCLIALSRSDIVAGHTTHLEIDPMTILGVVSGLIPYPHHNQSPRNTYQCAMGKQAMGTIALNQYERIDTVLYLLTYPQKPLLTTRVLDMVGFDRLGAGANAIIAVMSYSGYDIEDAVVLNRASLDRGYGRCCVMKKEVASLRKYANGSQDMLQRTAYRPSSKDGEETAVREKAIDVDGLPMPGAQLREGDLLMKRLTPASVGQLSDDAARTVAMVANNVVYHGQDGAYIDRVLLASPPLEHMTVKVLLRSTRRPELGDKFSSRHGQKGVTGLIVGQEDLPFNEQGICVDMIMNPHGFPSRMTVAKMIELIGGKAATLDGRRRYGTAFAGDRAKAISWELTRQGYHYAGKELMTSGLTGETQRSYVYHGPIYYQKLKHMVADKMHARARGPVATLTRQPTEGRARDGGLRLGEMERDSLVGHGCASLVAERLLLSSDAFDADVCSKCGLIGSHGWCQYCRSGDHMAMLRIPYAFKLLVQELSSMNIVPRLALADPG